MKAEDDVPFGLERPLSDVGIMTMAHCPNLDVEIMTWTNCIKEQMKQWVGDQVRTLIVDFSRVHDDASAVLIVNALLWCKQDFERVFLCNIQRNIRESLTMLGIETHFISVNTRQVAMDVIQRERLNTFQSLQFL